MSNEIELLSYKNLTLTLGNIQPNVGKPGKGKTCKSQSLNIRAINNAF